MRLSWVRTAMAAALAVGASALAVPFATAAPSLVPGSPLKQTITAGDWSFELHGPSRPELQVAGYPTEIVVRHRPAGIVALLQPTTVLPCPVGGAMGCVPIDLMGRTSAAVKRTRMVVSGHGGATPPEVSTTFFTGVNARCCYVAVGFSQPSDGRWRANRLNSGDTEPISDRAGRIRAGDRRWETLDWPRSAARPFYVWHRLTTGEGWRPASTRADVQAELRRTTAALRRLQRRSGPRSQDALRATRGVRIGYQQALGQRRAVAAGRRAYRRLYGSAALARLDSGLKRVATAARR